ncbi:PepSY-associated TM helix domain-containing protein [Janthinobacterium violaceinigrum]|uniref:PepSY domain-containing protein n=1 Tax=Janthinobacterium violaceinigrum TaxID=2654252 RepID=A0A6I1HQW7_9BURK|nr:PepSY-associated TM helix domain-containing protein [Janthinobacterium violaceinigrum]KAB8060280.1 PepSY domain-containing protein [Janthinobacterium violaceinigrum]
MSKRPIKWLLAKLHLYAGLWFGALFVLLGLTGSAIAWMPELDAYLNPTLLQASTPAAGQVFRVTPGTVQAVVDQLTADPAYGKPAQLNPPADARDVYVASYRQAGKPSPFSQAIVRQVMVDPYTLQVKGERDWGRFGLTRPLLMSGMFHLHRYLLTGDTGKTVTGISGVLLLLMALSGIYLWWPRMQWMAVKRALTVSHGGSWPRFNYTLHKAAGFFAAPVLAVIAFSGIYFNLPQLVVPLVDLVSTVPDTAKLNNVQQDGALLDAGAAMAAAQRLYPQARVSRIVLPAKKDQPYDIRVRQPDEIAHGDGATRITLDARSGLPLRIRDPLTASYGERFLGWQFPLHSGQAFGVVGRSFITLFGLMPLLFMLTGTLVWWKRRRGRK